MELPLNEIDDGYLFQRIVAEYFRSLNDTQHEYRNAGIKVDDSGIGGDDGCDILVEFIYEDAIHSHSQKWIIECKSQKTAVRLDDLHTNNIDILLRAKGAVGYLLVCKTDATASLKRIFSESNGHNKYVIWNGTQLWHKLIKSISILQAFFPVYYRKNFIDNQAKDQFASLVEKFEQQITEKESQ